MSSSVSVRAQEQNHILAECDMCFPDTISCLLSVDSNFLCETLIISLPFSYFFLHYIFISISFSSFFATRSIMLDVICNERRKGFG